METLLWVVLIVVALRLFDEHSKRYKLNCDNDWNYRWKYPDHYHSSEQSDQSS